jgi:hypothetical protein
MRTTLTLGLFLTAVPALAHAQWLTQEPIVYCDRAGQYFITGTACPADSNRSPRTTSTRKGPAATFMVSLMPSMGPPKLTRGKL